MKNFDTEMQRRILTKIDETKRSLIGQPMIKLVWENVWNQTKAVVSEPTQKSDMKKEVPTGQRRGKRKKPKYIMACTFGGGGGERGYSAQNNLESILKKRDDAKAMQKKKDIQPNMNTKKKQPVQPELEKEKAPPMKTALDVVKRSVCRYSLLKLTAFLLLFGFSF